MARREGRAPFLEQPSGSSALPASARPCRRERLFNARAFSPPAAGATALGWPGSGQLPKDLGKSYRRRYIVWPWEIEHALRPTQESALMRLRYSDSPVCTFGYLDESGSGQRYFACGAVIHGPHVSGRADAELNRALREAKKQFGFQPRGDIGWKKVPTKDGKYRKFYNCLVDMFFGDPRLMFKAVVVNTGHFKLDSRQFYRGSKDAGMDSLMFHLMRSHLLRDWHGDRVLYLRFDRRDRPDEARFDRLRSRLCALSLGVERPTISTRNVQGGSHPLMHVVDLLLGTVTAGLNERTTSPGRLALMARVQDHLGRPPWLQTAPNEAKFNVWHFKTTAQRPAGPDVGSIAIPDRLLTARTLTADTAPPPQAVV